MELCVPNNSPFLDRCSIHGKPTKRASCPECNRVYMRNYLRLRRLRDPEKELFNRARKRAQRKAIPFEITRKDVNLPEYCPVLGIKLDWTNGRSANSPSLDRIIPSSGYVPGNVRVISDRANRLKGDKSLEGMRRSLSHGSLSENADQWMVYAYMQREHELLNIRVGLQSGSEGSSEIAETVRCLDRRYLSYGEQIRNDLGTSR